MAAKKSGKMPANVKAAFKAKAKNRKKATPKSGAGSQGGLTAAQKAKLPPALQRAILAKKHRSKKK